VVLSVKTDLLTRLSFFLFSFTLLLLRLLLMAFTLNVTCETLGLLLQKTYLLIPLIPSTAS
jgi:hypothetical protein